jgi:uncharacterized protein with GYD domain
MKDSTVNALVNQLQDRTAALRQGVETFGGKLLCYYLAFGEYDGLTICDFPDAEAIAAFSLMVTSTGTFGRVETTGPVTPQEAEAAMKKAKEAKANYKPPPQL